MKALLIKHQVPFGKTHDLEDLLQLAEPVAPGIRQELAEAEALTTYAVDARYPSEEPPLGRDEATHHLAAARKVLDRVETLLKSYLDAGPPGL